MTGQGVQLADKLEAAKAANKLPKGYTVDGPQENFLLGLLVSFLPTPDLVLTEHGGVLLVEHLLVLPGVHAVMLLLGDAAGDELWPDGPSLTELLHGAQLLDDTSEVVDALPLNAMGKVTKFVLREKTTALKQV